MVRKQIFLSLAVLVFCAAAYAGELISDEAANYYKEGVDAEKGLDFDSAMTAYQKVKLVDPGNQEYERYIVNNLGVIFARRGETALAEAAFYEALKSDPEYAAAHLNLARLYEMKGDKLKSLEHLFKGLRMSIDELKPKDFVVQELLPDKGVKK